MKILISSHFFFPQVGGIETVGRLLAEEFAAAGHQVKVVTKTVECGDREMPFEILRRPASLELLRAVRWCDVFFHNNISLQTAWPLLLLRRPWLVTHHVWIPQSRKAGMRNLIFGELKRLVQARARSVSISRAMAEHMGGASVIIPNPYQDDVFRPMAGIDRKRDLIFVGRLVSDKGVDLLIRALAELRRHGLEPGLSVVGSGPEEAALRALACQEGVEGQVTFEGVRYGEELARMLNAHRILVVPSRWAEPFGLVALEGIACGCVVVGSAQGGLSDAIGPCGLTFENGNVAALAEAMERLLSDPALRKKQIAAAEAHLRRHRRSSVAAEYLSLMAEMVKD